MARKVNIEQTGIFDDLLEASAENGRQEINIELIEPNPFQPRQTFDKESLIELAASIREHGFLGELLVRQVDRKYQLVYGERRLRAAKQAKLNRVPAQIRQLTDNQMLEIALTENVRENLNPVDEARSYKQMQKKLAYTQGQIAAKVGKSEGHISDRLSLLRYPDIAEAIQMEKMTVEKALLEIRKRKRSAKRKSDFQSLKIRRKVKNFSNLINEKIAENKPLTEEEKSDLRELQAKIKQLLNFQDS